LNDTVPRDEALVRALDDARTLVGLGVPIITGRLDRLGNPDGRRDARWKSWEKTRPNLRPIDRYDGRDALGAVTGVAYDVIDIDPRSGGQLSFAQMSRDLGDEGPEVYWEVATSSGGTHLYIAPLGIGMHQSFAPGLDLKAEGGFCFIPPTVRPSKDPVNGGRMVRYKAKSALLAPNGNPSSDGIRAYIEAALAAKRGARGNGSRGREELGVLEQACLDAVSGEQHGALLALIDELARSHEDNEYVFFRAWKIAQQMPLFRRGEPWTEDDVRGLLHRPGRRPIADATPEEAALIDASRPMAPQVAARTGLHSFATVKRKRTKWIWHRYIAEGDATIVDAEAGAGKSVVSDDIAARFSQGRGMPCESEVLVPAGNVLFLAPEDQESVQADRLVAAGANLDRIFSPDIELREVSRGRGKPKEQKAYFGGNLITFPEDVRTFHQWIRQWKIGLVIVDPVAAFLGEDINSNNDASVRRALAPLVVALGQERCGAWLIRHFNKDSKQGASSRGGGSVAFGAVARTHLIAGQLPESYGIDDGRALAAVKTNNVRRRKDVALAYTIEDSEIVADDVGGFVPRVEWHGEVSITADILANGEPKRRGPEPVAKNAWREFLEALFDQEDTYTVPEIRRRALASGLKWDNHMYDPIKADMGIRNERKGRRGQVGGILTHYWTTTKEKL
jgi:hypothetical protein